MLQGCSSPVAIVVSCTRSFTVGGSPACPWQAPVAAIISMNAVHRGIVKSNVHAVTSTLPSRTATGYVRSAFSPRTAFRSWMPGGKSAQLTTAPVSMSKRA